MEKILRYFTKDKLLVNLIVIVVVIFGVMIGTNIKREVFPPTDIDKMIINVVYPGASPEDVEVNAVLPIEDELKEISGIDEYTSISFESGAKIIVNLDQDVEDKQAIKDEVYRNITISNLTDLSEDVEKISVIDMNPALKSIIQIGISPKKNISSKKSELFNVSDLLKDLLSRVEGVSDAETKGYLDRQIDINVHPEKMNEYYISLNDIITSIQSRNIRSSGGTIQSVHNEKNILTIGQFENPMDVGNVIIRSGFEQKRIKVKDLATINDSFEDEEIKVRVNKKSSVVINIKKKENADIITTVENVKKFLKENENLYAEKFDITIVTDESKSISSLIDVVMSNAIIGFILVFFVLLIFLDFKTSFWTAFSIPFCLCLVLIFMNSFEFSLNILTLGAVITVLGMMVDDAIVISEVIYEKKMEGLAPMEAAIQGVKEVVGAVTVTITSTIVAFLPILIIKGTMGKFIYVYPVIITATLLFSLWEAVFILPNHLASGKKIKKKKKDWFEPITIIYKKVLKKALKLRYLVLILFVLSLIFTIILSKDTIKNFVLFWDNSTEVITADIIVPAGTALDETEKLTFKIEKELQKNISKNELVSIYSTVGVHSGFLSINQENWATIQVKLVPIADRTRTAAEIAKELRTQINIKKYPEYQSIILREAKKGPPTGEPIDIKIISSNVKTSVIIKDEIENYLNSIAGVKDIDNDVKKGKDELSFDFNYEKMAQFGVNVDSVAKTVRIAYEGSEATSIQTINNKLEFKVQIDENYKRDQNFLMNLLIPNNSGRLVKLKEIATLKVSDGQSSINHYNGQRVVTVTADVDTDKTTPQQVIKKVSKKFNNVTKKYPGTYLIYGGEVKESNKTLADLQIAFIMALICIYVIVVVLFRSFTQPFVVLSVIPFGIIGVLLAFTAHNIPLSFMALIGIIGLSGVVINDSIIMVEFINKVFKKSKTESKEDTVENISEGAKKRLRPIILTTVTTVAGLMPTVYGIGGNAQTLVPTVMAMSYGLLFATLLTLIFIPCLYMINNDIKNVFSRVF